MDTIKINKQGYLATHISSDEYRTYVCEDLNALHFLIAKLTGRYANTYPLDDRALPIIPTVRIASDVHIYGTHRMFIFTAERSKK